MGKLIVLWRQENETSLRLIEILGIRRIAASEFSRMVVSLFLQND